MALAQFISSTVNDVQPTLAFFIDVAQRTIDIRLVVGGNNHDMWDDVDPTEARGVWNDHPSIRNAYMLSEGNIIADDLPDAAVDAAIELVELIKHR